MSSGSVQIHHVWATNFDAEFHLLTQMLSYFSNVTIDTEFPGAIYPSRPPSFPSLQYSEKYYQSLKANVDCMNLIQLGITLTDNYGRLPKFDDHYVVWEFNFRDFDVSTDLQAPEAIQLLRSHGIDLEKTREHGIDSALFAQRMCESGLVHYDLASGTRLLHRSYYDIASGIRYLVRPRWICFQGGYDFAYLIKILSHGRPLPETINDFLDVMNHVFGAVFDVKHMMKCHGLYGGLERVAKTLGVVRSVGQTHCSGSDSLLTWQIFEKLCKCFGKVDWSEAMGVIAGLECHALNRRLQL
ncbi:PREDICTED: probable CCR4-associated factor 1 homolog 11 [Nelumbo nucifera]|uniref:poly(A)-specific ribonuclease n=2 Tax=Nelumbo nucifera TaxID=4432 RepID=A0A1U8ADN3_NELNU|nr:PREDICTED: probable CCR4-associated factor 1 homolog 11 [Nelumbo nucifera]DAD19978.1 TPA_asm: hypothetical protein HUJ06_021441 [Nelumbo nucifera]